MRRVDWTWTIRLLLVGWLLALPSGVRASCVLGDPELLWSYPAEGDEDVPLNAAFWVLSTWKSVTRPQAWLNEVPIASLAQPDGGVDDMRVQPGPLRANTDYTLRLRYAWPDTTQEHSFVIHFRTGKTKARPAAPSRIVGRAQLAPYDARILPCQNLFGVQGCFDTFDPARPAQVQTFELASNTAIAWFLETGEAEGSLLWPAQCGDPALLVPFSRGDECITVRAIGRGGLVAPAVRHCIGPNDPPTKASQRAFTDVGRALTPRTPVEQPAPLTEVVPEPVAPAAPAVAPAAPAVAPAPASKPATGCALHGEGSLSWLLLASLLRASRRRCSGR